MIKVIHLHTQKSNFAGVAKLVDALDLGSSVFDMGVRVPPPAQHGPPSGLFFNN